VEIQKRKLGKTDVEVTPIGLGVMQFAGGKGLFGMAFPDLSQAEKNNIIRTALDGGINWFDTAEMYGFGRSEEGLASGLKAAGMQSGDVVVETKWLPFLRFARNIPKTIDKRLSYLDGYNIDVYLIHQPMSFSSPEAEMDAMADSRSQQLRRRPDASCTCRITETRPAAGCQPDGIQPDQPQD